MRGIIRVSILLPFVITILFCSSLGSGGKDSRDDTKATPKAGGPTYIGAAKCKMCHMPYFKAWGETKHAKAFQALDVAKKEDKNSKCLKCHTTGFGKKAYEDGKTTPELKNVQCEACHGPGSDYVKTMKDLAKANAAGLVYPVPDSVCTGCHNKASPTFKGFDLKKGLGTGVHRLQKKGGK
ncbi:MAG: cytochrome c family protein [Candidatus Eisenbacteria bacterium]